MSHHEPIRFEDHDEPSPSHEGPKTNRPAQGAQQGTPGDIYEDLWEGSGQGTDFLGLEQDLGGAAQYQDPTPPAAYPTEPPASPYASAAPAEPGYGGELAVPEPVAETYTTSYEAEAETEEEFPGFDEEEDAEESSERTLEVKTGAGVWVGVGLALGLGAAAVVAVDYFGVLPSAEPEAPIASLGTPKPAPRPAPVKDAGGAAWSESLDGPQAGDADPLLDKLAAGEELTEAPAAGYEEVELTLPEDVSWDRAQNDTDPVLTVGSWFAPESDGDGTEGAGEPTPDSDALAMATPAAGLEAGGPVGPETPEGELEVPAPATGDTTEAREGQARFEAYAPLEGATATASPLDLAMMDVVWRGEQVPFMLFDSGSKIWTPQVGTVRATTVRGEVFDGRLVAVGQDRLWLMGDIGELALEAHTVDTLERLPDVMAAAKSSDIAAAAGKRVKATTAGGAFEGRVLAVQGSKVILVTDTGARITLEEPDLEPVREGVRVKVKAD